MVWSYELTTISLTKAIGNLSDRFFWKVNFAVRVETGVAGQTEVSLDMVFGLSTHSSLIGKSIAIRTEVARFV